MLLGCRRSEDDDDDVVGSQKVLVSYSLFELSLSQRPTLRIRNINQSLAMIYDAGYVFLVFQSFSLPPDMPLVLLEDIVYGLQPSVAVSQSV